MWKNIKVKKSFFDISNWILVHGKIFFLTNQPFGSMIGKTVVPVPKNFLGFTSHKILLWNNKEVNSKKSNRKSFCRKIFFSVLLEFYFVFLKDLFCMNKKIAFNMIILKKEEQLKNLDIFHVNKKSIQRLLGYLNRFYVKKKKYINSIDYHEFFSQIFFSSFRAPFLTGFLLFHYASGLYFKKSFTYGQKSLSIWEKNFGCQKFFDFSKNLNDIVGIFFNSSSFFCFSSEDIFTKKRILRHIQGMLMLKKFFVRKIYYKKFNFFLKIFCQEKEKKEEDYLKIFIVNFFKKNLGNLSKTFFFPFLKFFFDKKDLYFFFLGFFFFSFFFQIEEKLKNFFTGFSVFYQCFFFSETQKFFFETIRFFTFQKLNCPRIFCKLTPLEILNRIEPNFQLFHIFFGMKKEDLYFLNQERIKIKGFFQNFLKNYFFKATEIVLCFFINSFIFSIGNTCAFFLIKKAKLDAKIFKYFFSFKDFILNQTYFNIFNQKIKAKPALNEILEILFKKKFLLDLQISYTETRMKLLSDNILGEKNLNLFRFQKKQKTYYQIILNKLQIGNHSEVSKNLTKKFTEAIKSWSFLNKNGIKKKKFSQDYSKDFFSCNTIFLRINLGGNEKINKMEKNSEFFPFSIFRCLRFFSRFFFFEMIKEKQLNWSFSQTRILIEVSGFFCKKSQFFLIQVDFWELYFFLTFNCLQIILKDDMESFFLKNKPQRVESYKSLKRIGMIGQKHDQVYKKKFFVLKKKFFPSNKVTKVFTSSGLEILFEEKITRIKPHFDHIYVSEAIIVKILKIKKKIKAKNFFILLRRRLKGVFFADTRGLLFQIQILCQKGYIKFLKKENFFGYILK